MSLQKLVYSDNCQIEFSAENKISIQTDRETLCFEEQGKPVFDNKIGEVVIEFSGLSDDDHSARSWAKATYQPQGFSKLHYHTKQTEYYYIINGTAQVTLDNNKHRLSAGNTIMIPPGYHHQVHNISPSEQELVLVVRCEPSWSIDDMHFG